MGHERHDGLAGEIVGSEERRHGRRHGSPPAGRTDEDHIVLRHILDPAFQGGTRSGFDLFFRLIDHRPVIRRIGRDGDDLEEFAARNPGDLAGHLAGVAAVGVVSHQHFFGGSGLRLRTGPRSKDCCHRC